MPINTNTSAQEPQEAELSFVERAYELDRAADATGYCEFLTNMITPVKKLQAAVQRGQQRKAKILSSEIVQLLRSWPKYASLDVTEEHVEPLVNDLLLKLDIKEHPFSTQVHAAISEALEILQDCYLEADQYREGDDA